MNFSDRFLATTSGTTPQGNDPHQVAETLRKLGVPYQERYDWPQDVDTWDEFYEPLPPKLYDYAREDFKNRYSFLHEYIEVDVDSIKKALKYSPIGVGLYAWKQNAAGIYYSPKGVTANHFCVIYGYDDGLEAWKVLDSYTGYLKLYSYDSLISVAKRFYIEKKVVKLTFWQLIKNWLSEIFK